MTRSRYDYFYKMSQTVMKLDCHNHHTRAYNLSKEHIHQKQMEDGGFVAKNPLELFKMRKFTNIASRTNSGLTKPQRLPPLPARPAVVEK